MKTILFVVQDNDITYKSVTLFLIETLKKYCSNLHIFVISPIFKTKKRMFENLHNFTVIRYPRYESLHFWGYFIEYPMSFFFTFMYFFYFLLTRGFNCIYFTIQPSYYFLFVILCKIFNKKIFVDVCDLGDELFEGKFAIVSIFSQMLKSFDAFMIRNADVAFVHNKFAKERIKKEIKTKSSIVEYNGIPNNILNVKCQRLKVKDGMIVLHRAMLYKKEGVVEYAKCAKRFFEKYPDQNIMFYQVGAGELQNYIEQFIKDNNLEDKLILTGFISDSSRYWELIHNSDICVGMDISEDFNRNTLSTKYMEYTQAGKPIIAWFLPAVNEYLKDYIYTIKNGDIDGMVNAIYKFATDRILREKYSELSKLAYQKLFSEGVQKERILSHFNKILI